MSTIFIRLSVQSHFVFICYHIRLQLHCDSKNHAISCSKELRSSIYKMIAMEAIYIYQKNNIHEHENSASPFRRRILRGKSSQWPVVSGKGTPPLQPSKPLKEHKALIFVNPSFIEHQTLQNIVAKLFLKDTFHLRPFWSGRWSVVIDKGS